MKYVNFAVIAVIGLTACVQPSDPAALRQAAATRKMTDQADRAIGMPAISQFNERKLVRDILERRDRASTTWAYLQGLDGKLSCLGQTIGYGVPYGAQFTAPSALQWVSAPRANGETGVSESHIMAQPEPNGLYMPDSAAATWLQILNPETGKVDVIYVEPNVVVSPFQLRGPAVAAGC